MTKLSDTQALILSAAAQRPEHIALPLPDSLRGGAAAKVVGAMLAKGFLQEVDPDMRKGELVWRETGDGHGVTLIATDAGLAAIGIARAFRWKRMLDKGDFATVADLAAQEGIAVSYLTRVLRLTQLGPDLVEAILDGRHPPGLTLQSLRVQLPDEWSTQRESLLSGTE